MAELPRPGDSHGNLLWKIVINTFEAATGGGGGGVGPAGPAGADGAVGPQGPQGDPGTFPVGIESLADATAIWLTAAEDVGVGIAVPLAKLHVQVGDTTAVPSGAANTFVVEGTAANMGMTLLASSGNNAFYAFGNEFAPAVAYIGYNMAANQMWLATNDAIRMSIDSTGQVGIGTLSPDGRLHVFTASAGAGLTADSDGEDLVVEGNDNTGISILTPADSTGSLIFGDADNENMADVSYDHLNEIMHLFATDATIQIEAANGDLSLFTGNDMFLDAVSEIALIAPVIDLSGGTDVLVSGTNFRVFSTSVGIGTATPVGFVHIFSGSAGAITPETFADDLIIENSVFPGMSFLSPNDTVATIAFADPQDSDAGSINYNHTLDTLSIRAGGVETFYVLASKVGIGIPLPDGTLHVMTASAGAIVTNAFADELTLENNDHCGLTILTPNDKVAVIYFGDTDDNDVGQISYNHAVNTLTLTAGTVNVVNVISAACNPAADNTIRLGSSGVRWTEVFATNGVINTSDAREKHDIEDIDGALASRLVDKFTPRSYVWNTEAAHGTHYGFVAQEIEMVLRQTAISPTHFGPLHYDRENDRYGLRQAELLPFLWRVVQDLQRRVAAIET